MELLLPVSSGLSEIAIPVAAFTLTELPPGSSTLPALPHPSTVNRPRPEEEEAPDMAERELPEAPRGKGGGGGGGE